MLMAVLHPLAYLITRRLVRQPLATSPLSVVPTRLSERRPA